MSKLKIKNLLRLIGSLILVVVLALTFVACNENPGDDGADGSEVTEVITPVRNGEFIYFDDSAIPYTPSSWTLSSEYDVDEDDDSTYVISGVIDTTNEGFSKNKGSYGITVNPGKVGEDDNVLMINNIKPYSANYKSTAITLEAGKFYKLTLSVKTDLKTAENGGANVKITSSGSREYLAFESIKGEGWTQYNFFLEAKKTEKTTVYVSLSLGEGDENDDATLAKGVAFFDSVVLNAYTDSNTLTAEEQYDKDSKASTNADWNDATHATYDFSLPNAEFDNKNVVSSLTNTASPYDWSTKYATDENGDFKAPTTGLTRGVIDVTKYVPTKGFLSEKNDGDYIYEITAPTESKGNNVLMIYFTDKASPSAFAYTSSTNITFESEKTYKLSFWVRTLGILDKDQKTVADGGKQVGAAVKLGDELLFEDINTNGEWVQYSVFVKGSTTQNVSRALQFWLGQGYKGNEDDFVSGAAFFDCISLVEADYPQTVADTEVKLDFHSDNLIADNAFGTSSTDASYVKAPSYWTGKYAENHGNPVDGTKFGTIDLDSYSGNTEISATNPGKASDTRDGSNVALVIDNAKPAHYVVDYDGSFEVWANTAFRLSFWVKTEGIDLEKGLKVELINKGDLNDEDDEVISSLTNINTEYEDDDEDTDTLLNEWVEVVFSVHGHQLDDSHIGIRLTLGSGDQYSPDYIKGTVFASNMYYEEITTTEYNSASSGETSATYTFRTESSATVKNGSFNYIDIDKTLKTDSLYEGKITYSPAVPAYWTGKHVDDLTGDVVSGITNATAYENLGQTDFPYDGSLNAYSDYNGQPNLLMIWAKDATAYAYTSESHTLTASAFYKISVNVKTELNSGNAYVTLLSGTNKSFVSDAINSSVSGIATEDNWTTYEFYVKVGLDSATVKFALSLGLDGDNLAQGKVFFDNVYYSQITSDEYNDAVESISLKKLSLLTNSFETTAESFPANPSGFNGGAYSGAPSGTEYTIAGVVSKNHYDLDEMETEFTETITNYHKEGKFTGANDTPEFLIIYNKKDTAYRYVSSTNYSFISGTYYKVSFYAKTLALNEGDYAYSTLTLSDTDSLTFKINATTAVNKDANDWAKYTFYVKTADSDVTGVSITFGLGEYEKDDTGKVIENKYATGYAMFDEITIEDIEESVYESETESITNETKNAKMIALKSTTENETDDGEDDTTETTPLSTWEIIGIVSGAMLSLALVAVLVVAFIKKLSPRIKAKKTKRFKKPTYDKRKSSVANRDKLNKYKD